MKLEMDDNTVGAIVAIVAGIVIITVACFAYRYNIAAYELGYTQKQLQNSQQVFWVKEKNNE